MIVQLYGKYPHQIVLHPYKGTRYALVVKGDQCRYLSCTCLWASAIMLAYNKLSLLVCLFKVISMLSLNAQQWWISATITIIYQIGILVSLLLTTHSSYQQMCLFLRGVNRANRPIKIEITIRVVSYVCACWQPPSDYLLLVL